MDETPPITLQSAFGIHANPRHTNTYLKRLLNVGGEAHGRGPVGVQSRRLARSEAEVLRCATRGEPISAV